MPVAYIASLSHGKQHLGSAILLEPRLLLTCEHVVRGIGSRTTLTIAFHGQTLKGSVKPKSKDAAFDLALIQLRADALATPPAWSDLVNEHDQCHVLAWPGGRYEAVPASVQGTKRREVNLNNTLDEGSSGGAVVRNIEGESHCIAVARARNAPISHAIRKAQVEEFLAKHKVDLPVTPPPPVPPAARDTRKYFEDLRRDTGEIALDSLGVPREGTRRPVMDALYIPLRTSLPEQSPATRSSRRTPAHTTAEVEPNASVTLETALRNRCLVVVGEAGSGKTTFLRRIAWELCPKPGRKARRNKLNLPCSGFPMFIRVSSLDRYVHEAAAPLWDPDDPRWLARYLASQPAASSTGLDEPFFQEKLDSAGNILLLDGLDEAADEQRRTHIASLVAKASARGCRYVVSTRPRADEGRAVLPAFAKCEVLPLDESGIRHFLTTWCDWLPRDAEYLRGLLADVALTPRELRSNPFMLTALAVVYLQQKRLPHQRADLYEAIVDWLSIQAEERWGPEGYRRHFILNCLQRLGLAMQDWQGGEGQRPSRITVISVNEAAPLIMDQFAPPPPGSALEEARRFLERAHVASGVLTLRNGQVAFWHKLFQEYLAARMFTFLDSSEDRTSLACRHLYTAEGREMLPLATVRMKDQYSYLPKLFAALIADATPRPLPAQAHAVGVIGSMLRDLKSTSWKLPPLIEAGYQSLLQHVRAIFDPRRASAIPLQSRLEAAEALGAAGDSRLLLPTDPDYWVPVGLADNHPAFSIGRFPVTVHEYGIYLKEMASTAAPPDAPPDWGEQEQYPNRPVTSVSWHEAMAWCAWASRSGLKISLPTDAQWELAARGPENREYPWGTEEPTPEHANYRDIGIRRAPTPVGLFPAGNTVAGISDMAGNVWEWTSSVYDQKRGDDVMSVRGGSFFGDAGDLRAADRSGVQAGGRNFGIGFRCLRE